MTKIINKVVAFATLSAVLFFSACLSDSDYDNNLVGTKNSQYQNYVEVHLTSANMTNTVSRAYDLVDKDTIVNLIPVRLTSGPCTKDVTVTFKLLRPGSLVGIHDELGLSKDSLIKLGFTTAPVDSLLDQGYVFSDSTKYVVQNQNYKVTIPAGKQEAFIKVKFNASKLSPSDTYVFGVQLVSVDNPEYKLSTLNSGIVKYSIKNKYDGEFEVTGTMSDVTVPTLTGAYPFKSYLITQDGSSVALFDSQYNQDFYHLIINGSSYSVYGKFAPVFKFDENNKVISVVNYYGQPASNGRSAELDPSGVNKFDAATGVLKVKYWMNQPGSFHRTYFDETYTYIGPR